MIEVQVSVPGSPYSIWLGANALDLLTEKLCALHPSSALVVTNTTVGPLYGARALELSRAACRAELTALPDGEKYKNWDSVSQILEALAKMGSDRKSVVVALGGGVVGDLAGFAAAIYMRGIRVIQVPTTLLAQVDSSVGGKTGMNTSFGKNMVGAFHQPSAVIADTTVLKTLPEREISAGVAEIIKHGMLADAKYFADVESHIEALLHLDDATVARIVAGSCRIKASVVARDTKEAGERAKLNLGHTYGHAVEKLAGYGVWLHGEAVGFGLAAAAASARRLGQLSGPDEQRILALLRAARLPEKIGGLSAQAAIEAMRSDKKSSAGVTKFVLLDGIGASYVGELSEDLVREVLIQGGFRP